VSGGFESCIVYASRTTAKVAVTRQEGASLRRWSAEVFAGQGAGEQSQTQTGGRVPGVKGSQVQILSARPERSQVRGCLLAQEDVSAGRDDVLMASLCPVENEKVILSVAGVKRPVVERGGGWTSP